MNPINFRSNGGRLRSAIAATALIAASGAASAEPVNLVLNYTCPFPLIGNQAVVADISADLPSTIEAGTPTGDVPIDVIATVAENAKTGLGLVGAVSVEGTAESNVEAVLPTQTLPLTVLLDIPFTEIPVDEPGTFDVPAFGVQDSLTFGEEDIGTGEIQVEGLTLNMTSRTADGSVAPAPIGEFTAVCTLDPGQNNVLQTFEITGTGDPDEPQDISVDPESVDFGNVQAGLTEEATVTVSNAGDLPLGINGITIDGADASAFSQSSDCSVVNAGESCAVTVTYFPSGEGAQSATLTIESDDPDEQFSDVALSGSSTAVPVPEIVVEDEVNFGTVLPGETTSQDIVIGNAGTESLTINGIEVSGGDASVFTIGANDCTTVAPDASCSVTVTFAPQTVGALSSTLVIASNDADSPSEVALLGTGDDPGQTVVDFLMDIEGSTTIAASDSTLPLSGTIDAALDIATGMYTADLALDDTQATVQISRLFSKLKATAQVEFEQVGQTTGTLQDGVLTSESTMYISVPKVTVKLFGFPIKIGGGDECRTMDAVNISLQSPEGEQFAPLEGGILAGEYDLPPLENCGPLTGVLNHFLSGDGNTIQLGLTPIL
ncbi:choice-of-anchor D domain-containing protein [Hydrocarboniclastica marina]|uniref:Choice-of-anchor D domain n=1 Tax=Hydrocarboniclastica marina TaxID=2259620 RepID=A0A4V1D998_9ALTE|nr:choice-of-anchor D domain-containing protein [Hydrocarboniclastica marina]QCF27940.1 choice-of-anchor D domain [Hydrocarboniclastica marina]